MRARLRIRPAPSPFSAILLLPARLLFSACFLLTLAVMLAAVARIEAAEPAQSAAPLPKVRLLATGGTISNRTGGRLSADELIKSMPTLDRYVRAESEQFANTSSSALTLDQWIALARRVNALFAVVGSMRNPSTIGYEGAANLLEGFRVAADPQSKGKGVLVVMNDEINAAREVTKTDALRLQTFQTRGYGVLGVVDSDRVVYYRSVV
jgi:L-asparaginase